VRKIAVYLRRHFLLSLDDLLAVVREFLCPEVSRSGLDRCLRRHGLGNLRDRLPKEAKAPRKAFKAYEPGFLHISPSSACGELLFSVRRNRIIAFMNLVVPRNKLMLAIALAVGLLLFLCCGGCKRQDEARGDAGSPVADNRVAAAEPSLFKAVIAGDIAETGKIIDAGRGIDAGDALDRTALHMAAFYGRSKIIDLLVAHGADVNARDHTAMTPLHAAVISGGRDAVQALLERQADIQARNEEGQTALHLAAATGQPRLTKFLIERGADPRQKDRDGRTPLYYAQKNHHPQTTAVLEQAVRKAGLDR
jgi:hypothetical protein